jgi:hypothetical protein
MWAATRICPLAVANHCPQVPTRSLNDRSQRSTPHARPRHSRHLEGADCPERVALLGGSSWASRSNVCAPSSSLWTERSGDRDPVLPGGDGEWRPRRESMCRCGTRRRMGGASCFCCRRRFWSDVNSRSPWVRSIYRRPSADSRSSSKTTGDCPPIDGSVASIASPLTHMFDFRGHRHDTARHCASTRSSAISDTAADLAHLGLTPRPRATSEPGANEKATVASGRKVNA